MLADWYVFRINLRDRDRDQFFLLLPNDSQLSVGNNTEESKTSRYLADIPKNEHVVATNGVNFLPFLQSFEFPDMFAWLNLLGSIAIPRTDRCLHPRVRATSSGYPIPLIYLELHSEYFWSSRL